MGLMAGVLLAVTAVAGSRPDTTALLDFGVLDLDRGQVESGLTVLVAEGRVLEVAPAADVELPAWVHRIQGRGRTLAPGLVDAHVHMDSTDLPLFLANGITGIRDLNGSESRLRWRDAVAEGALPGPRMLVSTPLLAGTPFQVRHELLRDSADAARRLRDMIGQGYDYAKIYDGLSVPVYQALVAVAHEAGLPLTGHIPADVGLAGALAAGQSLEHAEKIVMAQLGHGLADLDQLEDAADAIARAGVVVTPTLAVQEVLNAARDSAFDRRFEAPEMAYVDSATLAWWSSLRGGGMQPRMVEGQPWTVRFMEAQRRLVRDLAARDVPIMAGTDTPNPLMVPGFSLHDELDALVRAGLSAQAALRAATVVPGEILPWDVKTGRIQAGYAADMVAVDGNPLVDLSILRHPSAVMAAGRWLDRQALDRLLSEARRRPVP